LEVEGGGFDSLLFVTGKAGETGGERVGYAEFR
jgi:hypothetical protein